MNNQKTIQCLFCQQCTSLCNLIGIALQYKYEHKNEITVEDFLQRKRKSQIIQFYEKIYDYNEEYLERQYNKNEQKNKLKNLAEYYKYQINSPRLHMKKIDHTINDYQKKKKNLYYNKIKQKLGLVQKDINLNRIKTEPDQLQNNLVLFDLTKDEPSKSVIEILNLMNNNKKKVQFNNQIEHNNINTQNSARNKIIQKQLKAILSSDVIPKYQNTSLSKRSQLSFKSSTIKSQILKSGTFHASKSPQIKVNRMIIKMKSSPLIQLPKNDSQNKIQNKSKNLRVLLQHKQ